jgi:hypothetical protein
MHKIKTIHAFMLRTHVHEGCRFCALPAINVADIIPFINKVQLNKVFLDEMVIL